MARRCKEMKKKRSTKELTRILWEQIDNCLMEINNPKNSSRDRMMWTQNLVALISRLQKLLLEAPKEDEPDLAILLSQIGKRTKEKLRRNLRRLV
jgi:hypothetical protein